jgi:hypothetical protein
VRIGTIWGNEDRMLGNMGENLYTVNIRLYTIEYLENWSKKLHVVQQDAIRGAP